FNDYMNKPNDDKFLEYEIKSYNTNERLKNIINSKVDLEDIRQLQKAERDEIICRIYESTGASIRQLSEVMGIGRGIIHNAVKNAGSNIPFL
ncbi:MAG: transposase, partial [Clostridiales bacterium]|nr:transposase [Clostridiales bacterium]